MNSMTFTRMTDAMLEIPFRMMELPFLMSAAAVDAMLAGMDRWSNSWPERTAETGGASRYTERQEVQEHTVRRARRGPTRVRAA
jgi:hypothetical protein